MDSTKYITVIHNVHEVTLLGKADAAPWETYLQQEGVSLHESDGKVELLLSAIDARYMGVRFQELSISVRTGQDSYFMATAFNSVPLFALAERRFFQTPYYAADILVENRLLALRHGKTQIFKVNLAENALSLRSDFVDSKLLLRLPKGLRKQTEVPHFFLARLQGETSYFPGALTSVSITPRAEGDEVFRLLLDSHFQVVEWYVRANASHSKSKTYTESS